MSAEIAVPPPLTPAERHRVRQIDAALEGLATASGQTLRDSVADLPRFVAVLDALIGADEHYQRLFRREVIIALQRTPTGWANVPAKHGFNVLYAHIHRHGVQKALDALVGTGVPSWTDIIRAYSPDYAMGNTATLKAHAVKARAMRGKLRPNTTTGKVRLELAEQVCEAFAAFWDDTEGVAELAAAAAAYDAWAFVVGRPLLQR